MGLQEQKNNGITAVQDALGGILKMVRIAMIILIGGFCFSGVKSLEQFEKGIILRFGAVQEEIRDKAGMMFAFPYPVDEIIKIPAKRTQTVESTTYWYKLTDEEKRTGVAKELPKTLKPGVDGYLLTGDHNIVHARCVLKYRIHEPLNYAFKFNEIRGFLHAALDNSILKTISSMTIDTIMNDKNRVGKIVNTRLQETIDRLHIGVETDPVELQISWPRQLTESINRISQANQKYHEDLAAARVYENREENRSTSQASQIRLTAETWATRKTSRAAADADTFEKLYPLYQANPDVISQTLYQDRMKKIMANVDEIFILKQSKNREIRINLPRHEGPVRSE